MGVFAVGTKWVRKEAQNDGLDRIEVCGVAQGGTAGEVFEPVVRPVAFNGASPMSVDPSSLISLYTREAGQTDDGELIPPWESGGPDG